VKEVMIVKEALNQEKLEQEILYVISSTLEQEMILIGCN
jgi:hypothetical protein